MDSLWITVLALAIAGIDPIGALIGIAALAGGAKREIVIVYGFAKFAGAIAVGTILALTAATVSIDINWHFPSIPDYVWASGQLILGLILLAIGIKLWRSRLDTDDLEPKWKWMFRSPVTLIAAGFLTGVTAPSDPTFDTVTYLVSQTDSLITILAAETIWIVVSQLPLTVLMVALAFNKHHGVSEWIQSTWDRLQPIIRGAIMGLLAIAGMFLIANVSLWITIGKWLPLR